ncbi:MULTISPECIES: acetyl-CoA C-acetyltransferase [Aneurinibacillus]|jgi:acetyl-CoA C-acetyltransferase|uniref:acetyl-CoA C-acetyltransferase n=1 Tax=Aneurinibacillus thermoaerophilus TaxID=143495 RepID=A0A1G8DSM6_ANETH|nr:MULTISPECIES: acetyl-CoA C-acetyltransferase [Aneurinibacillus]AMA71600.1 acetyl-CoA acetyltransferase [Aneurinibacillus sp. XH2]MED0681165.1 acetyl-CoA C-acetyltransferase [Aneurinibacillus thermoaerophilus]MED0735720.1 acetyl-CoA C-acetyltransferase [Aneurinibacillus thermoaerophilus]MED0757579.1 acetyl-CoA C-acetyltransferase [Aneurinibacillus thermoaerophilus]MED0759218.1 acetyl-CoA C-acetyltransferase [Aneurinibacillus thermoaerophilus]
MRKSVIVSAARTPFGKFGGSLSSLQAVELGGIVIKEAVKRAGISPDMVDEVIMGMVLQGGAGQIPSRQAARKAGLPWEVQTETINKVCASGLRSVTLADQIIRAQDADIIVAGGMESMSNAPYALPNTRWGMRMGDGKLVDLMLRDGLTDAYDGKHMAVHGSNVAAEYKITREEQDKWALRSQQRAAAAIKAGRLKEEIVPVEVPQRKGDPVIVEQDEAPRETSLEQLQNLPPVFTKDGTITAGNAPGVNDGAGAMVVMSDEKAKELGIKPLATILGHAAVGQEAPYIATTPGLAINKLLKKTGYTIDQIDLFEVNEAFAAVVLTSQKIAGWDPEKVNVNGGAIAFGHPIGASGARILMTLIYELRRRGGGLGIAAICSGAAQGDAILVEVQAAK